MIYVFLLGFFWAWVAGRVGCSDLGALVIGIVGIIILSFFAGQSPIAWPWRKP